MRIQITEREVVEGSIVIGAITLPNLGSGMTIFAGN
jgi:hypothetical protein